MAFSPVTLTAQDVFGETRGAADGFIDFAPAPGTVSYFVGRNGSGKSKAAKAISLRTNGRYLATDRLIGIMAIDNYGWGSVPNEYQGPPLRKIEREQIRSTADHHGVGTEHLLRLRDDPVVGLKVAAFLQHALGRVIELRESAGFLDPYVRLGGIEYSLLRDEGHGLRELTLLLAAVYSEDWHLLIVDEPELHLHPALAQLWLAELTRECQTRGSNAIVVTHEPTLIRPNSADDLNHVWVFGPSMKPATIGSVVQPGTGTRVTAALRKNPQLVGQLVFSPRPVLVEGPHDVAAITTALERTQPSPVIAQTELVAAGSSGDVVIWFEIARRLNLDVRAVADLDALFTSDVHRTVEREPTVVERLATDLMADPPRLNVALRPLIEAADKARVPADEKNRARWLADGILTESGLHHRRERLIGMLKDIGLWLHPEGTLEDVLGIVKGKSEPAVAASTSGAIDAVASWCAYDLNPLGNLQHLLGSAIERIANGITHALRLDPSTPVSGPLGPMSESDAQLVDVTQASSGRYRITVKRPIEFEGHFADFDRDTPPSAIHLTPPVAPSDVNTTPS